MEIDRNEYLERKHYEHELINRRLTWLLTSQSLLFAAYGLVFASNKFEGQDLTKLTHIIALVGSVIAGIILLGIVAAIIASCYLWLDVQRTNPGERLGVRGFTTLLGWIPDLLLPLVFIIAWWCLDHI